MRHFTVFQAGLMLLGALGAAAAATPPGNAYLQHNMVADQPGIADFTDPNLVNPWGIYTTASSPFWISDAGTGLSTVYSTATSTNGIFSISATKVTVPPSAKGASPAAVTGGIANATGGFLIQGKSAPAFMFVTADGTISGWASAINATQAQLMVDNSGTGAVYYGLAVSATTTNAAPMLYAANFKTGGIDVYDTNYKPVTLPGTPFVDAAVPAGYAPFNIWNLGGKLYVMWAKQNAAKNFAVSGVGNGAVSIFDLNGVLLQHVATGGPLNAPWGVAIAPATFGVFANDILVGNFGDGTINAFDPKTGAALGALADQNGNTISISGLWALIAGNGGSGGDVNAIYFAAGTGNQLHGLLGSLQAAPVITASAVGNAADTATGIASNTFITITGASLAPVTRNWTTSDFPGGTKLPTSLGGVTVTVDGKPAYVSYISTKQINVLTPVDTTTGPVQVVVNNNGLASNSVSITMQTYSPAFFLFKDGKSIAATHDGGTLVGATTLYTGESVPAQPGEVIALYGTGFGTTNPAITDGGVVAAPLTAATTPTITFGGVTAQVVYAGLIAAGVYQINVQVPPATPDGDTPVVATAGSFSSAGNAIVTVKHN